MLLIKDIDNSEKQKEKKILMPLKVTAKKTFCFVSVQLFLYTLFSGFIFIGNLSALIFLLFGLLYSHRKISSLDLINSKVISSLTSLCFWFCQRTWRIFVLACNLFLYCRRTWGHLRQALAYLVGVSWNAPEVLCSILGHTTETESLLCCDENVKLMSPFWRAIW